MKELTATSLIAPCGMNCGICMAYLREKDRCPGCRALDKDKKITVLQCAIKNCGRLNSKYCFSCKEFPCKRIKHLDKRYRTKYNMSMIENLENIKKTGIRKFVINEKAKWECPGCKGTICVHKKYCLDCGVVKK